MSLSNSISGPSLVCSSGASFSVDLLPQGATVSWYRSSNITRVSGQGSNPCTFAASSGEIGEGFIRASIDTPCEGNVMLPS